MTMSNQHLLLLNQFLTALQQHNFLECEQKIADFQQLVQHDDEKYLWIAYFTGVLANERDRDPATAEQTFQMILSKQPGSELYARVLLALGLSYDYQGRWLDAIEIYQRLLSLYLSLSQAVEQAKVLKNIAIAYEKGYAFGELNEDALLQAQKSCQDALAILHPQLLHSGEHGWLEATIWSMLGLIHMHLGQWDSALDNHLKHLQYATSQDDLYATAVAQNNIGEIYQHKGETNLAIETYQSALMSFQQLKEDIDTVDVLANLSSIYQEQEMFQDALAYSLQAIQLAEKLRAGVSSESGRAGYFATLDTIYANAILLAVTLQKTALAFDLSEQARSRAFLDALSVNSTNFLDKVSESVLTLSDTQKRLPQDALLLTFFTAGLVNSSRKDLDSRFRRARHRFPRETILLFAITYEQVKVYDLNLSPNLLRPSMLTDVVERHFLQEGIRRTLFIRLLDPVETQLWNKAIVYLLPHGPLHYIPFHSLIASDGETLLRSDGPALIYAPSATILMSRTDMSPSEWSVNALYIGYNGTAKNKLAFAEAEVSLLTHQDGDDVLIGNAPKKEFLYNYAPRYRRIHFSCHGEFVPEHPLTSFLELSPNETLTAFEILEKLKLNCELTILSACESGLSRVRHGDEKVGLMRAFFYAGTLRILATLWKVDERSTFLFMQYFYKQVYAGKSYATALKEAQLYLRELTYGEIKSLLQNVTNNHVQSEPLAQITETSRFDNDNLSMSQDFLRTFGYLKGEYINAHDDLDHSEPDINAKIFSEPYYWAAFVLFCRVID